MSSDNFTAISFPIQYTSALNMYLEITFLFHLLHLILKLTYSVELASQSQKTEQSTFKQVQNV